MNNPSPKAVFFYTFLFLASALITLSIRSSSHHHDSIPRFGSRLRTASLPAASPPDTHSKIAFATFLAGKPIDEKSIVDDVDADDNEDGYFLGARVLTYQLLHSASAGTNNTIPFLTLVTADVTARKRATLEREGATIIPVEKLNASWVQPGQDRWRDVLAKLRLFELTQYSKICFIDADMLVTGRIDGVFYDEATTIQPARGIESAIKNDEAPLPLTYSFAARPDMWGYDHPIPPTSPESNYLNSGFFVFSPSTALFEYYKSLLSLEGRFDPRFPEQNLFNYAHREEGNMPWRHLWFGWNVNWPTNRDREGGARSFHAKYWDGDPTHDEVLKGIWRDQRWEMEGYWRARNQMDLDPV
jgi:alpha-N-acetylglucosamine transferase